MGQQKEILIRAAYAILFKIYFLEVFCKFFLFVARFGIRNPGKQKFFAMFL